MSLHMRVEELEMTCGMANEPWFGVPSMTSLPPQVLGQDVRSTDDCGGKFAPDYLKLFSGSRSEHSDRGWIKTSLEVVMEMKAHLAESYKGKSS